MGGEGGNGPWLELEEGSLPVEFDQPARSGLCHGPYCTSPITDGSPSEDFCSDACQTAWHATLTHPPMPPVSIHLPAPGLARWTPEGGAPVTPETSTWEPRPDALGRYARDRWDEGGADRWAADVPITDPGPIRTRLSIVSTTAFTPRPLPFGALMAGLEEGICIECGRLRYEHHGGTCPTVPDQRSWLSRLRGWLRG